MHVNSIGKAVSHSSQHGRISLRWVRVIMRVGVSDSKCDMFVNLIYIETSLLTWCLFFFFNKKERKAAFISHQLFLERFPLPSSLPLPVILMKRY